MQLSYQAAFDPYHAAFRFLRLARVVEGIEGGISITAAKILDYVLLYPYRLREITLFPKHRKYKKLASEYESTRPYGLQPSSRSIFLKMSPLQDAAIATLVTHAYLDPQSADRDMFRLGAQVPESLLMRVSDMNAREDQRALIEFISVLAAEYPVAGAGGLKARTGLMEHRYDAV